MVAAGSVVTQSIPPHVLVAGNPAKPIGYVYKSGEKVMPEHIHGVEGGYLVFINPLDNEQLKIFKQALKFIPVLAH